MDESTPRRENLHLGSPRRLDGDIFHFKNNKVESFSSIDDIDSNILDKHQYQDDVKDTIMDDELISLNDSDDDDYTLELNTDSEEKTTEIDDNDNDSETRLFNSNNSPINKIKRNNNNTTSFIFEYDDEDYEDFDNTQYQFEPIEQRSEFFKLSFKFIPYGFLIFFTLLLFYNMTNLLKFDLKSSGITDNSLINHKILVLNDQVNELMSVKVELDSLKSQLNSVLLTTEPKKKQINKNNSTINEVQLQKILNKLESLEKRIDIDTNVKTIELSTIKMNPKPTTQIPIWKKTKILSPSSTYFNIANQCNIDPNLTTLPKRERLRKNIGERIIYGYADLIRRIKSKVLKTEDYYSWWEVISGRYNQPKIILNSNDTNSPYNSLKEEPNKLWLNKVSDLPVYLSLKFNDPVKIKEIGIHQNRSHSTMKANVREVSLFVQPANNIKSMKSNLKKYVNQELNFNKLNRQLKNWVRLGEMIYDIHDDMAYQKFQFDPEWISNWEIQKVMIIIHSNWGDEKSVILDSLRIFKDSDSVNSIPMQTGTTLQEVDDVPFL